MAMISIIIPAYNCAEYLSAAIESALAQLDVACEIIVVNDGSPDHTDAVVQPYLGRITYIKQLNRGLSAARNAGFRASSGEFICFLDADDILLPDKLLRQLAVFEREPDLGVVISGYFDVQADGETVIQAVHKPWHRDALQRLLNHEVFPPHAALIRRSVLEASSLFPEDIATADSQEDWQLWLDLALAGVQFSSVPEPTCKYRRRPGSISADPLRHLDGARRVVRWLQHEPRARRYAKDIDRLAAIVELERVARAWQLNKVDTAAETLQPAIRINPNFWMQPDTLLMLYRKSLSLADEACWSRAPDLSNFQHQFIDGMLPALLEDNIQLRKLRAAAYLTLVDLAYGQSDGTMRRRALCHALLDSTRVCISPHGVGKLVRGLVGPIAGRSVALFLRTLQVRAGK